MIRWARATAVAVWLPIVLLVAWLLGSWSSSSLYYPPLRRSLEALRRDWLFSHFTSDFLPSMRNLGIGYGVTLLVAIFLGVALGLLRRTEEVIRPIVEFLRATPGITLLPLLVVSLGLGVRMRVAAIVIAAVWPTLLNTIDGVRSIDLTVLDVARSLRLGKWTTLRRVILPGAAPQIFAGARTSLSLAVVVMVVTESVGAEGGIGYFLLQAQRSYSITSMWGTIILLGILGYVLNSVFRMVEAASLPWYRLLAEQNREESA